MRALFNTTTLVISSERSDEKSITFLLIILGSCDTYNSKISPIVEMTVLFNTATLVISSERSDEKSFSFLLIILGAISDH